MPVDSVLYSIRDDVARRMVSAEVRAAGLVPARLPPAKEQVDPTRLSNAAALVRDVDEDRDATVAVLAPVRTARPGLPILVLFPARPGAVTLAAELAYRIPRIRTRGIWHTPEDPRFIRTFLREARESAPGRLALSFLLRPCAGTVVEHFLEAALDRLLRDGPAKVREIAREMGLTERQLRLRWPAGACPTPGEMIAWTEMTLVATMALSDRLTPGAVARRLSHDERSFSRLRWRLGLPVLGLHPPENVLELVTTAYGGRWRDEATGAASEKRT